MAITPNFDISKVKADLEQRIKTDLTDDVLDAVYLACQEIVNGAKSNDTYRDQTNLLRSSIGFVIYKNGQKVHQYFEATHKNAKGTKGDSGVKDGLEVAESAAQTHPQGIVACIVAGANYALAVESKGYDVLTSHVNEAPTIVMSWLKKIEDALGGGTPPSSGQAGQQLSLF